MIMAGRVQVDGRVADKAGSRVTHETHIVVLGDPMPFVGRGGLKLAGALDAFAIDPRGRVALDGGASTGGFTDCLLQRGARRVYAVDVGYGQLAWSLRRDPRVVPMERVNLRHMKRADLPELPDLITLDLSFISVAKVLPAVADLLAPRGDVVALVKPQFEAGPHQVGKGGIVRDPLVHRQVLESVAAAGGILGFTVKSMAPSVIRGADGNQEYFIHFFRTGAPH